MLPMSRLLQAPRTLRVILLALVVLLLAGFSACRSSRQATLSAVPCQRVVSLSPSITEVLYALNLGNRVVGVTRFCHYPADANRKPKVGGYVDPDLEALLRLKPDLVILREEQTELSAKLQSLGLPTLGIDHRSTPGILRSFTQIGRMCHAETQAQTITSALERHIQQVVQKTAASTQRPRVMVIVDRDLQVPTIRWVYATADDGFYNWMIAKAGGVNALPNDKKGFLQISAESILRLNPDIIIEILPAVGNAPQAKIVAQRPWQTLPALTAVRNHRLYLFTQEYMAIPGPRFTQILAQFAEAIHPESDFQHDPLRSPAVAQHP
jgi:iron complex transport system substrate-binding protein